MATEPENKTENESAAELASPPVQAEAGGGSTVSGASGASGDRALATRGNDEPSVSEPTPVPRAIAAPSSFGTQRFVYAGYFAFGMAVAFVSSKAGSTLWYKLALMKPGLGEPQDQVLMPISAALGIASVLFLWRQAKTRELVEEVAVEMASVTWPEREEVTDGTTVVIATTLLATVFFALMDRFWSFVTDLVYRT